MAEALDLSIFVRHDATAWRISISPWRASVAPAASARSKAGSKNCPVSSMPG